MAARGVPPRTWIAKRPPLARMALAADDGVRMLKETNACGCSESVLKLLNVMPRHTLGVEVAAEEEAAEEEAEDEVVRITTGCGTRRITMRRASASASVVGAEVYLR